MKFDEIATVELFRRELAKEPEWIALHGKTQVFNKPQEGVKTRGSHCEDVGDISSRLVAGLGGTELQKRRARLTGLVHDLGHIPYGHAGESVADSILKKHKYSDEELKTIKELKVLIFGEKYANAGKDGKNGKPCFEHNENSVIQYLIMCERLGFVPDPEIMLGIVAHSTSRYLDVPPSLIAQAVRLADKLAYINYDINDLRISFKDHKEEKEALDKLYRDDPLKDPDGNEIKIVLADGRELTMFEFTMLTAGERIDILVEESVREAKAYMEAHPELQGDYETYLTGCNDVIVALSQLKKQHDDEKISDEEYNARKKELRTELYQRSPIMYAAYEIKSRTDGYIITGKGLSEKTQEERTFNAQSAVGNLDLKNEYIYKSLITLMEKIIEKNINIESLDEPLKTEFVKYEKFKEEQNRALRNIPGNDKGLVFPEIYTIVNFIGTHTNKELDALAEKLGISENYEREVLPLLRAIQENEKYYNKTDNANGKAGTLTKAGRKLRDAIVTKYGAKIRYDYGAEEENVIPTISDEMVELLELHGFEVGDRESTKSSQERLEEYRSKLSQKDQEYVDFLMETIVRKRKEVQESQVESEVGRKR